MIKILKLASEYAKIENLEFEVGLEHISNVLEHVYIGSKVQRSLIYHAFGFTRSEEVEESTLKLLGKVEKKLKKKNIDLKASCSQEVLDALNTLLEYGYDLEDSSTVEIITVDSYDDLDHSLLSREEIETKRELYQILCKHSSAPEKLTQQRLDDLMLSSNRGFKRLENIAKLKSKLNQTVANQEYAVEAVCDVLVKMEHIQTPSRPDGILLFIGPPGTGKTYLAQALSENHKEYNKHLIINMTQYTHKESGGGLYGTNRMWGNASPGLLTTFVKNNPKSIIVFDEFEKAHPFVQNNLLSILSEGYLNDACGWCSDGTPWTSERKDEKECQLDTILTRIKFGETIIIFTSNLGANIYDNKKLVEKMHATPEQLDEMIFKSLEKKKGSDEPFITAPLISRLRQGKIVLFNRLNYSSTRGIAQDVFESEKKVFEQNYSITIESQEHTLDVLLLGFTPSLDIRAVKSSIGKKIFDTITDNYMQNGILFKRVKVSVAKEDMAFLAEFFENPNSYVKELKHKNRALHFEIKVSNTKTILKLELHSLEVSTVEQAEHFLEGGLSIEVPNVTFSQIAGHSFVKTKLQEITSLLKEYKTLQEHEIMPPKGMLLYGPPGTGKTMLAKALANEADLPFISTTGKELFDTQKIEKVFEIAREYAPSIIFIDEIDSIPSRDENPSASIIINTLLTNIDGFESFEEPIFIIAATNKKERIDEALLRSGRLDLHVEVAALDQEARKYFIDKMLQKEIFEKGIDIEFVLKYTTGLNGSDLEKVERESILYSIRKGKKTVTQEVLIEEINTVKYGRRVCDESLKGMLGETAYHEAGHAVISILLNKEQPIEQVTVMPRKNTLGFVSYGEGKHRQNPTKESFKNRICIALAGRVAQAKKYGSERIDTGASSDLEHANHYINLAITEYGMDEEYQNLNTKHLNAAKMLYINEKLFKRHNKWLKELTLKTKELVDKEWRLIDKVAQILIKEEELSGERLHKMTSELRKNVS